MSDTRKPYTRIEIELEKNGKAKFLSADEKDAISPQIGAAKKFAIKSSDNYKSAVIYIPNDNIQNKQSNTSDRSEMPHNSLSFPATTSTNQINKVIEPEHSNSSELIEHLKKVKSLEDIYRIADFFKLNADAIASSYVKKEDLHLVNTFIKSQIANVFKWNLEMIKIGDENHPCVKLDVSYNESNTGRSSGQQTKAFQKILDSKLLDVSKLYYENLRGEEGGLESSQSLIENNHINLSNVNYIIVPVSEIVAHVSQSKNDKKQEANQPQEKPKAGM